MIRATPTHPTTQWTVHPRLQPAHLAEGVDAEVEVLGGDHEERVAQPDGHRRQVLVRGVVLVGQHLPHQHDGHQLERLGQGLRMVWW